MIKNTPIRQEAEKQYSLTFETFEHTVPRALQKLKGNVNSQCLRLQFAWERDGGSTGSQAPTLSPLQRCAWNIAISQHYWRRWTDQSCSRNVVQ